MIQAIREHVTIKSGGVIELRHPELPAGTEAEVIIMVEKAAANAPSLESFIGTGKGCFANAEEIDSFLNN